VRTGWECVHVCVDDATRLAYAEVLPDERTTTVLGFLRRAVAFYRSQGVAGRAADDRQRLGLSLGRPRPPPPSDGDPLHPNPALPAADHGKAERFIRTMLREWAYAAVSVRRAEPAMD
jgi:hypothetical protein